MEREASRQDCTKPLENKIPHLGLDVAAPVPAATDVLRVLVRPKNDSIGSSSSPISVSIETTMLIYSEGL